MSSEIPAYRTSGMLRAETTSLLRLLAEGDLDSPEAIDGERRRRLVGKVLGEGSDGTEWARVDKEILLWHMLQLQDALYPDAPEPGWISEPRPGVGEYGERTVAALLAGGAGDGGDDDGGDDEADLARRDASWSRDVIDLRIRQIVAMAKQLELTSDDRRRLVVQLEANLEIAE